MTATTNKNITTEEPVAEEKPDLEVILPDPANFTAEGYELQVRRLKAKEFFLLMRVLTQGAGPGLAQMKINTQDPEQMQADLMALIMFAVPNAIEEFGAFLAQIVEAKKPSDADQVKKIMQDPEIDTIVDALGILVVQEKDDLVALGGKVQAWMTKISGTTTPG